MSYTRFDSAALAAVHQQFVRGIESHGPGPFTGFDDVRLREHELNYKHRVLGTATALLQLGKWDTWSATAPVKIFGAALAACAPGVALNMMEMSKGDRGNSAAALFLTDKEGTEADRATLGLALYQFFCGGGTEPAEVRPRFEALYETVGKLGLPQNWPWYAYLLWLLSPDRYAPVRPRTFDRALAYFGSGQKMSRNLTWEPYAEYAALIAWTRDRLRPLYGPRSLIDAHSFLFVAFYYGGRENPLWDAAASRDPAAAPQAPDFAAELARRLADAERRETTGLNGERAVYEAERERLAGAGRRDLADRVQLVSADRTAAGFDILSFDTDGSERHVEVKTTTRPRSMDDRFFLTENERAVALRDPAWRVVRVWDAAGRLEIADLGNVVTDAAGWEVTPDSWAVHAAT